MTSQNNAPLSDDEMTLLDSFLLSDVCSEGALSIDEAHGFMTALALTDCDIEESDLEQEIWGDPVFTDEEQASQMRDLLRRLRLDLLRSLTDQRNFEPLVVEIEEEGEVVEAYEGWCFGFMLGVAHSQDQWDTLPTQEQALLTPMASLALLADDDEETELSEQEYADWVELLPGAVMGLYDWWHTEAAQ